MAELSNYLTLSDTAQNIASIYTTPVDFNNAYKGICENEQDSFLRHSLINNVPFAFRLKPMLYEQLAQYLADHLGINPNNIKLIGSAKSGFSISPDPDYGKAFTENSDLDFTIVNESLFDELNDEFNMWAQEYKSNVLIPFTDAQKIFWPQNLQTCPGTLARGFIDVNKIPSYNQFYKTKLISQSLFLIRDKLEKLHKFKIKKASIRVYKNWVAFKKQLKLNTEVVLRSLPQNGA